MKKKVGLIVEIVIFVVALCALTGFYYFSNSEVDDQEESVNVGIVKITDDNFSEEVLNSDKPVVLEFTSKSCPPCVAMLTTLIDIAKNNGDIKIGTVDMDDDSGSKIVSDYEIAATPTIVVFEQGEVKDTLVGAANEEQIMELLGK